MMFCTRFESLVLRFLCLITKRLCQDMKGKELVAVEDLMQKAIDYSNDVREEV